MRSPDVVMQESRNPESIGVAENLDSGFRRNDG